MINEAARFKKTIHQRVSLSHVPPNLYVDYQVINIIDQPYQISRILEDPQFSAPRLSLHNGQSAGSLIRLRMITSLARSELEFLEHWTNRRCGKARALSVVHMQSVLRQACKESL